MGIRGLIRFFSVRAFEGIIAILLITFMPNIPPHAKYSETYKVAPPLELEGSLALNDKLNDVEVWHKGDFVGPETFAVYKDELYTSIHGGDIVKLVGNHILPVAKFGKPCKGLYEEHVCGRPLGLTFDKNGALYVADAYYGLFKVDVKTGKQLQLVSLDHEIGGKRPKLPNSLVVTENGDLYWTDSSTEFQLYDGVFDLLADGSGRLIHYNAKTKKNTVLIDGLHFANGVALSQDESFLIVAETGRSRIHRYYLKGSKKGTHDIFIDRLPGLPDNLKGDGQGGFLVPLVVPIDSAHPSMFQIFGPFPLARKFISRLFGLTQLGFKLWDQVYPNEWAQRGIHFVGHFTSLNVLLPSRVTILHVSEEGKILTSLHTLSKKISSISEATVFKGQLYLGSPFVDYIARIPLAKVGLQHLDVKAKPSSTAAPTQAPKVTTQKPREASRATTPPPTQAPKITTQAPRTTQPTTTTTQAPKTTKSQKAEAPKPTTQAPPKTTEAPKTTTPAPKPKPATEEKVAKTKPKETIESPKKTANSNKEQSQQAKEPQKDKK